MMDDVIELEDQNELLRQQVEALAGSSQEVGVFLSMKHGMTQRLAVMLAILVKRSPAVVSKQAFHSMIYGSLADGGPDPKIFAVHIARLRDWLSRIECPGKIDTVWNTGYRADPALVKWAKLHYAKYIPQED